MPIVYLLNPLRRKNKGTSAGVRKAWATRRAKYAQFGPEFAKAGVRPVIKDLHEQNLSIRMLKKMTPAERRRYISDEYLDAMGIRLNPSKPRASRKPAARRKNAWFGQKTRHMESAKKKWKPGEYDDIDYYGVVKKVGVPKAGRAYRNAYPDPATRSRSKGTRKKWWEPPADSPRRDLRPGWNIPHVPSRTTDRPDLEVARRRSSARRRTIAELQAAEVARAAAAAAATPARRSSSRSSPAANKKAAKKGTAKKGAVKKGAAKKKAAKKGAARKRTTTVRVSEKNPARSAKKRKNPTTRRSRKKRRVSTVASRRTRRSSRRRRSSPRKRRTSVRRRRSSPRRRRVSRRRRRTNPSARRRTSRRRRSSARRASPRRRRRSSARRSAPRRRRRSSARRASPRRRRSNPSRRRRRSSVRRSAPRRRRRRSYSRRRRNPIGGILGRLRAAVPTLTEVMDLGVMGLGFVGVNLMAKPLFKKLGLEKVSASAPGADQAITSILASAATTMALGPRRGKQVLYGGLMSVVLGLLNKYVVPKLTESLSSSGLTNPSLSLELGDFVTFGRERMGGYVSYPLSRAGQSMGDYVEFGDFMPASAVRQASLIPQYESAPYDVGMPMGEVDGYYGVTAF